MIAFIFTYVLSIILGIVFGLCKADKIKKNFPEFFSPILSDDDLDFYEISKTLKVVNSIPNEDLAHKRFIQSR